MNNKVIFLKNFFKKLNFERVDSVLRGYEKLPNSKLTILTLVFQKIYLGSV